MQLPSLDIVYLRVEKRSIWLEIIFSYMNMTSWTDLVDFEKDNPGTWKSVLALPIWLTLGSEPP